MKVDVYWNSNEQCFSVRSREKEHYGKVIAHMDSVLIEDVQFVVNEGGRAKVLDSGVKNVHAFIRGRMVPSLSFPKKPGIIVRYNPFESEHFVDYSGNPIHSADFVLCSVRAKKPVVAAGGINLVHTNEKTLV